MAIGHCKVTRYSIVYASVQVYSYLLGRFPCSMHTLTLDAVMLLAGPNTGRESWANGGYGLQPTGHLVDRPVQLSDSSQRERLCSLYVEIKMSF